MQWTGKRQVDEHKELLKEIAAEKHRDRVFLEMDRLFAAVWPHVVHSENPDIQKQLPSYEQLLREGVESQWGPCEFVFDRENVKIKVYAADGCGMELISGAPLTKD